MLCDCTIPADHLLMKILERKPGLFGVARARPGLAAAHRRRGKVFVSWNVEITSKWQQNIIQYSASCQVLRNSLRQAHSYIRNLRLDPLNCTLPWSLMDRSPLIGRTEGYGEGICIEHGKERWMRDICMVSHQYQHSITNVGKGKVKMSS